MAPDFRSAHGRLLYSSTSSGFPSPPILPRRETQPTNVRIRSESPTILQTYPPPSDRHTSRIAALGPNNVLDDYSDPDATGSGTGTKYHYYH
jgi:hypothetical protein